MARLLRFVIPGQPQHVIQRGNNRQEIFSRSIGYRNNKKVSKGGVLGTFILRLALKSCKQ